MSETTLVDSSMDFASLAKMRLDAARNPEKTVDKVAEQFESIFINMMLKSMRNATERSSLMVLRPAECTSLCLTKRFLFT